MAPLYKAESAWVSSTYHEELMDKSSLCREANKRERSVPLLLPRCSQDARPPAPGGRECRDGEKLEGFFPVYFWELAWTSQPFYQNVGGGGDEYISHRRHRDYYSHSCKGEAVTQTLPQLPPAPGGQR